MNTYKDWILSIEDRVATLTLNRPDTKNSLGQDTLPELNDICQKIERIPEVAAVVIQGQGDSFCSGADLRSLFGVWQKPKSEIMSYFSEALDVFHTLDNLKKPTIAKIEGYCIAGGFLLACFCDFRIASTNSTFALFEAKRSIMILMLTQQLKRICGLANAKEMTLLAERFDAHKAERYNLLNEVCSPENLDSVCKKWINKLKKLPTLAVVKNKLVLNAELSDKDTLSREIEAQLELVKTEDFQEAIASFKEKREGNYAGK